MIGRYEFLPFKESAAQKYVDDPHYRILVDTMTGLLWNGDYTPSEIRQAAIFAAMKVEATRIRPMIFDPDNYMIEEGVLSARPERKSE
jgi:hypothetical protein